MNEKEDKKWVCSICDKEISLEENEYIEIIEGTYEDLICSSCVEDLEEDLEEDYEVDETSEYSSLKEFMESTSVDRDKYPTDFTIYGNFGTDEGHENPLWKSNDGNTKFQETSSSYVPLIDSEKCESVEPLNGQGTETWSDGRKYVGEYKDGVRDGQGTFYYTGGSMYVGSWKDGKQWNGIHYGKYGKYGIIYGKFVNGEWINYENGIPP